MKLACLLAATAAAFNPDPLDRQNAGNRRCDVHKQVAVANFDNGFGATGQITLTQFGCKSKVTIEGKLHGLTPGAHGWHIH